MRQVFALTVALALACGTARAEQVVSAVHAFAPNLGYTQSFLGFVDEVNRRGAGVVRIELRGGPEAIGPFQQGDAVRDGIVDMAHLPASFYAGALPEKDALVTSNRNAVETRANGGIALIDQIHRARMGVTYLGWFDSGVCYNLYTVHQPQLNAAGDLTISNLRLRGSNVYNAFFTQHLGAQVIDLPTGEVYAALERGVVNATGWTQIGLAELGWDDFLHHRIDPCFFSTDIGVIFNLEAWEALTPEAQALLQEVAIEHEASSIARNAERRDAEFAALEAEGMQVLSLEPAAAARYLQGAREETWNRMRAQMQASPWGDGNFDTLIGLFYDFERSGG